MKIELLDLTYSEKVTSDGRLTWRATWMAMAELIARRSTCPRAAVGCTIVRNNRVVSTGYNGAPSGDSHCFESGCILEDNHCVRVIHAEQNALLFASPRQLKGSTAYVTHEPCVRCRAMLHQMGVEEVYYAESLASWRARNNKG